MPIYDIPTAVEILNIGTYKKLPSILERPYEVIGHILPKQKLEENEIHDVKRKLEEKITIKLLWESIPPQYMKPIIEDGRLILEVENEFKVSLTLLNEACDWTILDVDVFVAPQGFRSKCFIYFLH